MTREQAVDKGLDKAKQRKLEKELYGPLDDFLKRLKRKIKTVFAPLFVSAFDELHIIRLSKTTAAMYEELDAFNRKNYLKLIEHARKWAEEVLGKKLSDADLKSFMEQYLKGYDPVTQYVYAKEIDRKRMRLNESVMTAAEFYDIVKLHEVVRKAIDLWFTQSSQYALDLMLEEIINAYDEDDEGDGEEWLMWNAIVDGKECEICHSRNGKVYEKHNYPPRPHYKCRCYPTKVKDAEE